MQTFSSGPAEAKWEYKGKERKRVKKTKYSVVYRHDMTAAY